MSLVIKNSLLVLILLVLMQPGLQAAVVVTDADGTSFSLPQPARRIISLAPHITELMFAVGAGERLVGTVEYSDYPKRARSLPRVGNHQALDLEAILALKPDLVLAWSAGGAVAMQEKLQALGVAVYASNTAGLQDIAGLMRTYAQLAGVPGRGEEVARDFERQLDELRQRYAHQSKLRVFMQIWDRPLMTINGNHYINDVITLCGGENIFADLGAVAPTVGVEAVIKRNPDIIFVNGMGKQYRRWLASWRHWPQLPAVRHDDLYEIKEHTISQQTPRILLGAKRICSILHDVRRTRAVSKR